LVNNAGTTLTGGSYLSASWNGAPADDYDEFNYRQTFGEKGTGDLEVNITGLVEKWIAGDYDNYGVGVMLNCKVKKDGKLSYYTKKFSARSSEYFFSRPVIEARWNSTRKDQRGSFYVSSSNLSAADNKNTIYLYNYVRGQPKNLANVETGPIYVNVYTSASQGELLTAAPNSPITGGYVDVGIYSASFALDTSASLAFDRWFSGSSGSAITTAGTKIYHTGSFIPQVFNSSNIYSIPRYVTTDYKFGTRILQPRIPHGYDSLLD
jgi:hypothetical protein